MSTNMPSSALPSGSRRVRSPPRSADPPTRVTPWEQDGGRGVPSTSDVKQAVVRNSPSLVMANEQTATAGVIGGRGSSFDVNRFLRRTLSGDSSDGQPATSTVPTPTTQEAHPPPPQLADDTPTGHSRHGHFASQRRREHQRHAAAHNKKHAPPPPAIRPVHQQSSPVDAFLVKKQTTAPFAASDAGQPKTASAKLPVMTLSNKKTLMIVDGNSLVVSESHASLASEFPFCRICHLPEAGADNPLVAPCRCAGTMQYVHIACLVHWLEICSRKMCPTPKCELCGYYYKTHNYLKLKPLRLPRCSAMDRMLHLVFVIVVLVMLGCTVLCFIYLQRDPYGVRYRSSSTMGYEDVVVVACSILFFCSFFVAVFTQYRAEASLCRIGFRCYLTNQNWRLRNYSPSDDAPTVDYVGRPHPSASSPAVPV